MPTDTLHQQVGIVLNYQNAPKGGRHFLESCQQYGVHFKELRQLERLEVILLHLIDSFDVAFLPAIVANYLNDFLIARPLRGCDMRLTFSFCYLKSSRNPSLHALGMELQQKYAMLD